jgi:hypothetical protein
VVERRAEASPVSFIPGTCPQSKGGAKYLHSRDPRSPRGPPVAFGRVVEDGPDSGSLGAVREVSGWRLFCGSRASVTANTREHTCWRNWAAQKTSTGGLNGSARPNRCIVLFFIFFSYFLSFITKFYFKFRFNSNLVPIYSQILL